MGNLKGTKHGEPLRWLTSQMADGDRTHCWPWPFSIATNGYGSLRINGKNQRAHRVALDLEGRERPSPKHYAAHEPLICHNRSCVNPNHLRWATRKENMDDMKLDGTWPAGEAHARARLTESDIRAIRSDTRSSPVLAEIYGVTRQHIGDIRARRRWKHV